MPRLPVVAGFGGINAAGRSSFHQGYRRLVLDALPAETRQQTLSALAHLRRLQDAPGQEEAVLRHTLIRRIEPPHFDVGAVPLHSRLRLAPGPLRFRLRRQDLPQSLDPAWRIQDVSDKEVSVEVPDGPDRLRLPGQALPVSLRPDVTFDEYRNNSEHKSSH